MDEFQSRISSNYEVAKSYYQQRRDNLRKIFSRDMEDATDSLIKYINNKIDEYEEQVSKKVYSLLDHIDKNSWIVPEEIKKSLDNEYYETSVENVLKFLSGGKVTIKSNQNVAAALGNEFENFLERALMPEALEGQVSSIITDSLNSMLSGFSGTGSMKSKGWTVNGEKNIRPDIGLNMATAYKDSDGVLRLPGSNLAVELQEEFYLDDMLPKDITSNDILKAYLDSNSYGFSLKVWKSAQGKEFAQSKQLQAYINQKFQEGRKRRKTWESTFTNEYVVWQISRLLINIIGPMNVGIMTGKEFIWMDDFLTRKIFFMDVQLQALRKSTRGPGYEGFPELPSSSIKIRQLTNDSYAFSSSLRKNMNQKIGRIAVRNRKLT